MQVKKWETKRSKYYAEYGKIIKQELKFKYLGTDITNYGAVEEEI